MATDITSIVQNLLRAKEDHDRQVDQLTEKLEKSCRLCLCEEATQISLFSYIVENVQYIEIANKFTDVAIERDDKLPTRICGECSNKLAQFHKFKLKCEKSRSYLESIYNLLYKVSPSEQSKQDELVRKTEHKEVHENFEIVEVLEEEEEDDEDDGEEVEEEEDEEALEEETQMPVIEEEFGYEQENNSYNVHLSEEGDLSFTPLSAETVPVPPGDGTKALRRGFVAASTSLRRETLVTTHQNQTKIEEHISYVADEAADKKEKLPNKSYSQKILLQTRVSKEQVSTPANKDNVTKRKVKRVIALPSVDSPVPAKKSSPSIKHEVGVEKKFKNHCDLCGASYKLKSDFKQHIVEAHGLQHKIECTLCGKVFVREAHLKLHMRIHTNNRPYPCDVCDKRFIKSSDLLRHKKIHSDDKDYSCGVCQKAFKRLGDVKSHMRTHTGERPYKCTYCKKPFSSHTSMKKHVMKNHSAESGAEPSKDD